MSNAPETREAATAAPANDEQGSKKKDWIKAGGLGVAIAAIGCLFAIMFLWPMTTTNPKGIDLGVVAPEAAKVQITKQLEAKDKDLFDITTYSTADEAKQAIKERKVTGALVVGQDGSKQMLRPPPAMPRSLRC